MLRLEKRPAPSRFWSWGTPVLAVLATMVAGGFLFALLGKDHRREDQHTFGRPGRQRHRRTRKRAHDVLPLGTDVPDRGPEPQRQTRRD